MCEKFFSTLGFSDFIDLTRGYLGGVKNKNEECRQGWGPERWTPTLFRFVQVGQETSSLTHDQRSDTTTTLCHFYSKWLRAGLRPGRSWGAGREHA